MSCTPQIEHTQKLNIYQKIGSYYFNLPPAVSTKQNEKLLQMLVTSDHTDNPSLQLSTVKSNAAFDTTDDMTIKNPKTPTTRELH